MKESATVISAGTARMEIGERYGDEYARRLVAGASDCLHGLSVPLTPFSTVEYDRETGTWTKIERALG